MKKKLLSALLAMCMAFGSAAALPENTFVDDISITSAAAESEETSWWEDVTLESYDVYNGNERYKIAGFHNSTVTSIFLNYRCLNKNEHYQDLCACIGEKAFNGYYHNLHKINIDSYYQVIEKDAFINSFNLTEYIIPGTVKSIGSHAIGYELDNGEYKKIENFDKIKIICTKDSAAEKYAIDNGIDYEINDPNFDYVLRNDDTYKITGYNGDERDCLVIPSAYRGKKVTFIGSSALCWIHAKEVVIPDSVIAIEPEAFSGNTRVKKVTIGKGVKRIPYGCFESSDLETIVFSEGLEEIGYNAFLFCTKLKEIKTPSTLEKIGEYAFNCCYDLKTVQLNDGITDISEGAFWGSGLETINLPKSITFIGAKAFRDTPWLENKRKETSIIQINDLIIDGATVDSYGVIMGNGIKHICDEAFYDGYDGAGKFTHLRIKECVETIGREAFHGCKYLSTLYIDDGLKEIKDRAFYNCPSLEEVTIPKSVTKIGEKAFGYYAGDDRNPNFLIKCYKDSAAHKYALANDLTIELLDVKHDKSHTLTKVPAKEATCISEGNKLYYRCDQCGRWYSDAAGTKLIEDHSKFVLKEDWSKHNWGTPTFTWADDYSTCYGSRRCLRDSSHGLEEKVDTTVKVKIPATCTAKGTNTYIAEFTYLTDKVQTKDVQNIAPLGHKWGSVTYTWSKDYSTCTATRVCQNDKTHKQIETVKTTAKTKAATCTANGSATYTSAKFKNSAFKAQTKTVTLKAPGHKYSAACTWAKDNKSCTMKLVCANDKSHAKTVKATVTSKTTPATCTEAGKTVYTAKATVDKKTYTTTRTVTIKALGHKMGEWKTTSFNVDKKTAVQTRKCTRGDKTETKTVKNAIVRYAGSDRAETATLIANALKGGNTKTSDTVIIATGFDFHDALAAVPLASAYNAPLLLADRDNLSAKTLAKIKTLKPKNIIVVATTTAKDQKGYDAAIKSNVYKQLSSYKVTKLTGSNYYATAKKVAEKLQNKKGKAPTSVFITTDKNYADALSASPVAAILGAPILYVDPKANLNAVTKNYLASIKKSVKNVYIVGGVSAVSTSVEKSVLSVLGKKSSTRFAGSDRYETCIKINKTFAKTLTGKSVCIAKGYNFPDALAGGVFAAQQKAPLFLADKLDNNATISKTQSSYLKFKNPNKLYIFGGETAVPKALVKTIAKACV